MNGFDRDGPFYEQVPRFVHHPHRPFTQHIDNRVLADLLCFLGGCVILVGTLLKITHQTSLLPRPRSSFRIHGFAVSANSSAAPEKNGSPYLFLALCVF